MRQYTKMSSSAVHELNNEIWKQCVGQQC